MAAPTQHFHHHHHDVFPPLDAPGAFQILSQFLSDPNPRAAADLRSYLADIRSIAFYYRFLMDTAPLGEVQLTLVRQFIAQTYAAQQVLERYPQE